MKVLKQALVADVDEIKKRWVVLLTDGVKRSDGIRRIEHPTAKVDPQEAIQEAIRAHVEYADSFQPVAAGRALYNERGEAVGHPSVVDGWLHIHVLTLAGVALPETWMVRLQGYGDARETQLEAVDETELGE